MTKKSDNDDSDPNLFRTAMRGVKPLSKSNKIDLFPKPKPYIPRKKSLTDETIATLSDLTHLDLLTSDALVEFKHPGIQHKTLRKLRSGQYNIEAILDMHGMTVADAKDALVSFLAQCEKKGCCHVLIIHGKARGKGNPTLKNRLNDWLRQLDQVLAFCSAAAKDGRSGAMYVLLKNKKGRI